MRRRAGIPLRWAFAGVFVARTLLALGRRREARATERLVDRLLAGGDSEPRPTFDAGTADSLPDPVRRYFEAVSVEAVPEADAVRIEQTGELRVGGTGSAWQPFTATHHATVDRPGFVWDATVELFPFVTACVRDALLGDEGSGRVSLFGAFPVGGAGPTPELNEAALQRYLAEAVWYPRALLPENGVTWEGIDDRSARATLRVGWLSASLSFDFSATGEVERVHTAQRYRRVDGGFEPTPWTGAWRAYEERNGVRVPTEGEVVWHLAEGDHRAWRGRVQDVTWVDA